VKCTMDPAAKRAAYQRRKEAEAIAARREKERAERERKWRLEQEEKARIARELDQMFTEQERRELEELRGYVAQAAS